MWVGVMCRVRGVREGGGGRGGWREWFDGGGGEKVEDG